MIGARLCVVLTLIGCIGCQRASDAGDATPSSAPEAEGETAGRDGDIVVGPAFDGVVVRGTAGGPVDATAWDPDCLGGVFDRPNHVVTTDEARPLTIDATPNGQGIMDLTLIVRAPDGTFRCSDDGNSLDPVLAVMFEPGRHQVWVGTHVDQPAPYELRIRSGVHTPDPIVLGGRFPAPVSEGEAPERTTDGTFGGLRVPANTALATLTGQAGGTRAARELGPDCVGYIAQTPDHIIEILAPEELMLRVDSSDDTTLVIRGPNDVVLCTDDDDGLNPVVRRMLPPGRYAVFVGTYEPEETPEYILSVSR